MSWNELCSLKTCSSVHGILQARILEWVAMPFSRGSFLTQGSNLGLLHYRRILYHLSHQRNLKPSKEGTVMNPMIPIGQVRKLRNRELEKFAQGHTELMVRQVSDPQIWVPKNKLLSASLLIFQSFFSVSF